jgi:putative sigma-54 modulation protein
MNGMSIEYTGRHTTITNKQKAQAEAGLERIGEMMDRAFCSAHVILSEDKYRKIAEIAVLCAGQTLVATNESTEMDAAIHGALAKLEQQWVRRNQKVTARMRHPGESIKTAQLESLDLSA